MQYAKTDGAHIAFRVLDGADDRDLVMVSGFNFPMEMLPEDRIGARLAPAVQHRQLQRTRPGGGDHALGDQARAVGEVHSLTGGEPPHRGGVPSLGAVQHHQVSGQRGRVAEKDRWPRVPVS